MGDSDDEYNRRRGGRDKFMKERSDFQDKRRDFGAAAGGGGDRRTYGGSGQNRLDYKQFRGSGRPDTSPPIKRMRRDWDEAGFDAPPRRDPPDIGGSLASGGLPTPIGAGGAAGGSHPSMMTFKQFLTTQDDSISDEDAIQKYQDYKLDYKRQQLHSFFIAHKDEEWFRLKYHPEDSAKRKVEQQASVQRRAEVFQELYDKGWMDKGTMDHTNGRYLIKLMDAVVVKLEGGTDEDLVMLDKMEDFDELANELGDVRRSDKEKDEQIQPAASRQDRSETLESGESFKKKHSSAGNEEGALSDSDASDKGSVASEKSKSSAPPSVEAGEVAADRDSPTPTPTKNENDDNIGSPSGDMSKKDKPLQQSPRQSPPPQKMMLHKTASIFLRNLAPSITRSEVEALCKRFPGFLRVALAEPIPDRKFYRRGWISFRRDVNIKEICWNLNNIRLKDCDMGPIVNRDLTRRIRTVNGITIHKQVAQNDLRLAARLVQIYDKKYGLFQNEPSANANDDRKSYDDNGYGSVEFNASKNPLLKNITDYLIEEASAEEEELLGTASKANEDGEQKVPIERDENLFKVLDRILLYLRIVHSIDYYNHGEYPNEDEMPNRCGLVHVRGPPLSPSQYGQDEKGNTLLEHQSINEFCKMFESRLQPLLSTKERISDEEAEKLGRKDSEKEVEAFINANCQELAKDKWLCPLSGKKFKGPEFVRKHVTNKHGEKLEEVRVEVVYFNNYLYDSKRPGVPDPKPLQFGQLAFPAAGSIGSGGHDRGGYGGLHDRPPQDHYRIGYAGSGGGGGYYRQDNYGGGYGGGGGGGGGGGYRRDHYQRRDFGPARNYGGGSAGGGNASARIHANPEGGRRDPRVPVAYTDLDAPEDVY